MWVPVGVESVHGPDHGQHPLLDEILSQGGGRMDSPRDPKDKGPVGDDQFLSGIRVTGTAERPQGLFPLGAQRSRCSLLHGGRRSPRFPDHSCTHPRRKLSLIPGQDRLNGAPERKEPGARRDFTIGAEGVLRYFRIHFQTPSADAGRRSRRRGSARRAQAPPRSGNS